jgi:opacity protein-like surface antigen
MKTKMKLVAIAAMAVFLSKTAAAQEPDTVRVIKETQVVHDTVVVKDKSNPDRPSLRMGEFGIRYMPTFTSLSLRNYNGDVIQGEMTMSHGIGAMMALNLSRHVGIQAEVSYLDVNQKYKDRNLDRQVNVSYLNIPVMLSLNTNKTSWVNWNFVAGPQFGVNLGSDISTTGDDNSATVHAVVGAKGTDVGLAYGTGLEFALSRDHNLRLDLGYRGFYGLVDASADQYKANPNTYNVIVRASRMTQAAYLGLTLCF